MRCYLELHSADQFGRLVHFIFRHKNPLTGEWEEKHLKNPPTPKIGQSTALYTLIVKYV
jgi:hypothetical protein